MQKHGAFPVFKEYDHPKEFGIRVCISGKQKLYQSSYEEHLHADTFVQVFKTFTTLWEAVTYRDTGEFK